MSSNSNTLNTLLSTSYELNLPYDETGVKLINKHYEEVQKSKVNKESIREIIVSKLSNYKMNYNNIDLNFKDLINDICVDYYDFVENEITKLALNSNRKIATINDLRLYCSLINGNASYNCNEFILSKVCNTNLENSTSKDNCTSENLMCMKGIYKLKQKYSNLFYSYWEQYDKCDINFTDLMVIELTWGKILSSSWKGAGRDTIHQICNFTYKCEESQQELRRDFCRFLYNMKTPNWGLNRDEKYCNWYKFLWNILKHQTLKDKTITKKIIDENYPSFPEYKESCNYIEVIRNAREKIKKNKIDILSIRQFNYYYKYLDVISIVDYNSKATFKYNVVKKKCNYEWKQQKENKKHMNLEMNYLGKWDSIIAIVHALKKKRIKFLMWILSIIQILWS